MTNADTFCHETLWYHGNCFHSYSRNTHFHIKFKLKSDVRGQTFYRWRRVEARRGGYRLRKPPRHLTTVRNSDIRSNTALVLFQNGALFQFNLTDWCLLQEMSEGRGGLVVGSKPRGQRVPGSKSASTEDTSCMGPVVPQIIRERPNVVQLVWCGSLERGSASSGVVLVICPRFKMMRSISKQPSFCFKVGS
ncbi:hypothetical protein AVEN_253039-1 [Araneus ventricosus]|uniref:Uncharacterized protein n=1 Tax=Araneus ventricosus TaxID=182803 RepID=A0A4Y2H809_ARAVE|nr:hypothetical protein AVEN_253039-1 [Araneus ventricosus]